MTEGGQTRTKSERSGRGGGERLTIDALRPQDKAVLAVLTLAAIWPARFPGGWVGVDDFAAYGQRLGRRGRGPGEALSKAIGRGLERIERLVEPVRIETRPSSEHARELDRRLHEPFPASVHFWLLEHGRDYLIGNVLTDFLAAEYRPLTHAEEIVAALEETVIHTFITTGRKDAVPRARAAFGQARSARDRRALGLALATALIRGSKSEWAEAETILTDLIAAPARLLDHHDRVTEARLRIALAYCCFMRYVRKQEPATDALRATVAEIRKLLAGAQAIATDLSFSDRAQVANTKALLLKWEAQVETDPVSREELYEDAERHLLQALGLWRIVHDSRCVDAAVYNLAELRFSRHRLHLGYGEEAHIREALRWYEASVRFTEMLESLREWVLDYLRAGECITLLVPHLVDQSKATPDGGVASA